MVRVCVVINSSTNIGDDIIGNNSENIHIKTGCVYSILVKILREDKLFSFFGKDGQEVYNDTKGSEYRRRRSRYSSVDVFFSICNYFHTVTNKVGIVDTT